MFHTLSDEERSVFARGLRPAVRPGGAAYLRCFSDREPPDEGPQRVCRQWVGSASRPWWDVDSIEETRPRALDDLEAPRFSPVGPKAYLIAARRTQEPAPTAP